jgi:hypothetical protein
MKIFRETGKNRKIRRKAEMGGSSGEAIYMKLEVY